MAVDRTGRRLRRQLIAFNLAVLVTVLVFVGFGAVVQRRILIDGAEGTVVTVARSMEAHFDTVFRGTFGLLRAIDTTMTFSQDTDPLVLLGQMGVGLSELRGLEEIALLTPEREVTAFWGSLPDATVRSLARRTQLAGGKDGTALGGPLFYTGADGSDRWLIPLGHPTVGGGWLVAYLGSDLIEAYSAALGFGPSGVVGLMRNDGVLLARVPSVAQMGTNLLGLTPLGAHIESGDRSGVYIGQSGLDGRERVTAFASVPSAPVTAYVGIAMSDLLRDFVPWILTQLLAAVALVGVAVALSLLLARAAAGERRVQRELATTQALAAAMLDATVDGLVAVDGEDRIIAMNPSAGLMFGIDQRDAHGLPVQRFLPSQWSLADANPRKPVEIALDGRPVSLVLSIHVPGEAAAGPVRVLTLHDLTHEIEQRQMLERTENMRMIGQLTGGVAHDFNNILTIISLNLEMMGTIISESPVWEEYGLPAVRATARGASLTGHLLAFARRQPLSPEVVDPNAALHSMKALLERTVGECWTIELFPAEDAWPVLVDLSQLETALINLALNARDAMADGGSIVVETRNVTVDPGQGEPLPGDYVRLSVADQGTGMPPEVMERVFEPFFTTKPVGKGTGLGLSMVYGFAKQSNGHLTIYSEVGRGTTVKLYLPRALARPAFERKERAEDRRLPNIVVLVVEDDADVRRAAVRALAGLGLTTVEARDAEEALSMARAGVAFDLLFTDVVLPRRTGRDLAQDLRAERPGLAVLFTSGYTEGAMVQHGRLEPGVVLLSKPYTPAELRRQVFRALAVPAGP